MAKMSFVDNPIDHSPANIRGFGESLEKTLSLFEAGELQFEHGMPEFEEIGEYLDSIKYQGLTTLAHLWIETNEYLSYGIFLEPRIGSPQISRVVAKLYDIALLAKRGLDPEHIANEINGSFVEFPNWIDHMSGIRVKRE